MLVLLFQSFLFLVWNGILLVAAHLVNIVLDFVEEFHGLDLEL